jgi:hypothetical protein
MEGDMIKMFPSREAANAAAAKWAAQKTARVSYPAAVYENCNGRFFYVACGFACADGCSPLRNLTESEFATLTSNA